MYLHQLSVFWSTTCALWAYTLSHIVHNPAVKRLSVTVDTDLHKRLRIQAAHADTSMNDIVVKAIELYLQHCSECGEEKNQSNWCNPEPPVDLSGRLPAALTARAP